MAKLTPALRRLMELQIEILEKSGTIEEIISNDKTFIEDLVAEEGLRRRSNVRARYEAALGWAGMQLLSAHMAAQEFPARCLTLLRARSLPVDVSADWCRSLAWHHAYLLRERGMKFTETMRAYLSKTPTHSGALRSIAADFKKRTDPKLSDRGRHIHEHEVDDPLIAQASVLGLLESDFPPLGIVKKHQARALRRHVLSSSEKLLAFVCDATEDLAVTTEPYWTAILRSSLKVKRSA